MDIDKKIDRLQTSKQYAADREIKEEIKIAATALFTDATELGLANDVIVSQDLLSQEAQIKQRIEKRVAVKLTKISTLKDTSINHSEDQGITTKIPLSQTIEVEPVVHNNVSSTGIVDKLSNKELSTTDKNPHYTSNEINLPLRTQQILDQHKSKKLTGGSKVPTGKLVVPDKILSQDLMTLLRSGAWKEIIECLATGLCNCVDTFKKLASHKHTTSNHLLSTTRTSQQLIPANEAPHNSIDISNKTTPRLPALNINTPMEHQVTNIDEKHGYTFYKKNIKEYMNGAAQYIEPSMDHVLQILNNAHDKITNHSYTLKGVEIVATCMNDCTQVLSVTKDTFSKEFKQVCNIIGRFTEQVKTVFNDTRDYVQETTTEQVKTVFNDTRNYVQETTADIVSTVTQKKEQAQELIKQTCKIVADNSKAVLTNLSKKWSALVVSIGNTMHI